ncbi:hypothetical protein D030_2290B, partial [Vibrio parahaemolyticus AQ3810]
CHSKRVG